MSKLKFKRDEDLGSSIRLLSVAAIYVKSKSARGNARVLKRMAPATVPGRHPDCTRCPPARSSEPMVRLSSQFHTL